MKKLLIIVLMAFFISSCASLTKSQINQVNRFSKSAASFSAFPSQILISLNEIRTKRNIFFANSFEDTSIHLDLLDSTVLFERRNLDIAKRADITFKIIDKYAQSLALVSNDVHEKKLQEQIDQFGESIDVLISEYNTLENVNQLPATLGTPINKVLSLTASHLIRSKQAKIINELVPKADVLIAEMIRSLIHFLETKTLNEMIAHEDHSIRSNYQSFLNRSKQPSVLHDMTYLNLKYKIYEVRQLQKKCIRSAKSLRKAHKKLVESVQTKKKIKELKIEFHEFYEQIKELKSSIEILKN